MSNPFGPTKIELKEKKIHMRACFAFLFFVVLNSLIIAASYFGVWEIVFLNSYKLKNAPDKFEVIYLSLLSMLNLKNYLIFVVPCTVTIVTHLLGLIGGKLCKCPIFIWPALIWTTMQSMFAFILGSAVGLHIVNWGFRFMDSIIDEKDRLPFIFFYLAGCLFVGLVGFYIFGYQSARNLCFINQLRKDLESKSGLKRLNFKTDYL